LHRAPLLKGYAESQIHNEIMVGLQCKPTPARSSKLLLQQVYPLQRGFLSVAGYSDSPSLRNEWGVTC